MAACADLDVHYQVRSDRHRAPTDATATYSPMSNAEKPPVTDTMDIANEPVYWDLGTSKSYGEYLKLDLLLSAQQPNTFEHDEMLFIIIHQATELWMKLGIHELTAAINFMRRDDLGPVDKSLTRVARIQAQLTQSWDVLATMTPMDYSAFRNSLGKASGFQSFQYRMLEFLIGNKHAGLIEVYKRDADIYALLQRTLHSPSLYDEALRLLSRRGFGIPADYLDRDWSQPYQASKQVAAAWLAVYHNREQHWDLYELAEKLVDFDHKFQLWRFSHMKTVERIIGYKRGTGGTGGVSYLTKALELRFFPELWSVRTSM
jgi:tryptophan 2,3-dioxygenase